MILDLVSLYTSAFGYVALPFNKGSMPVTSGVAKSQWGNQFPDTKVYRAPCTIGNFQLPNEPMIEIKGPKKSIVETGIDGIDGTAKQIFGIEDYLITIKGIAIQLDGSDSYPEDIMRQINILCKQKNNLDITNAVAQLYGINKILIYDVDYPAVEGAQSWQPYILTCKSDFDFDLKVKIEHPFIGPLQQ